MPCILSTQTGSGTIGVTWDHLAICLSFLIISCANQTHEYESRAFLSIRKPVLKYIGVTWVSFKRFLLQPELTTKSPQASGCKGRSPAITIALSFFIAENWRREILEKLCPMSKVLQKEREGNRESATFFR